MKTTLGIEFEPFFPQISHRAKIGCEMVLQHFMGL